MATRKRRSTQQSASRGGTSASLLAGAKIKRIQSLLTSKAEDGVALGISLLESLGGGPRDYEAVFTDRVLSAIARAPQVVAGTVLRWEQVLSVIRRYPRLLRLFDHHAGRTVQRRKGRFELDGLRSISARTAKALASRECTWDEPLNLSGIEMIDSDVARALARFPGELWLDGLKSVSKDVAAALANHGAAR